MNRRLSESGIRGTCRELLGKKGGVSGRRVSGRALCAELRTRFGAVGKTERVFAIWREELTAKAERDVPPKVSAVPADVAELERRLKGAEAAAAENLKRAELAEYREQAHQERWGMEVDRLRQRLRALETNELEVRRLQERVLQLSRELMGYRP
jgi:hypothetical protein